MPSGIIFHVCLRNEWERAQQAGQYRADTLETDGFIHCSTEKQIGRVAEAFSKIRKNLLILEISVFQLCSKVAYERSHNGELYPHVYGPINLDAVIGVKEVNDGTTVEARRD